MSEGIPTIVKWGKETIELKLVPANGVKALKVELEERTGVPVERMKLMSKSKGESAAQRMHGMCVRKIQHSHKKLKQTLPHRRSLERSAKR